MTTVAEALQAHKQKMDAFMVDLGNAIDGVRGDIDTQAALIKQLQESPGTITPEDQAILDQLESNQQALVGKIQAVDAMTPPAPPPVTG